MIDWDAIQERGEEGMLTPAETDALTTMARAVIYRMTTPKACDYCRLCLEFLPQHLATCPISVLERVGDD